MSFQDIKRVLNDSDLTRILAFWVHSDFGAKPVDWDAAAEDYGSSTSNSFRTMIYEAKKKVKKVREVGGNTGTGDHTPSTPTSAKSKKRKPNHDDPESPSTARKKRAPKKTNKKDDEKTVDAAMNSDELDENGENLKIKSEEKTEELVML